MKNKLLVVLGVAALGVLVAYARRDTPNPTSPAALSGKQVEWFTDFRAAQERARAENKPLLVDFTGSDWCPPCMLLEKQVFYQSRFADYAGRNLVVVKIDFPRRKPLPPEQQAANNELARRFSIQGFPTILILSPEGKVLGQLGYVFGGPDKFIARIEEIVRKP